MAAHQALPSLVFSRQEHWSGLPFPSPMHESESEVSRSCPTLRDPMDCSLPGSSIHEIFQARALEWVAIAFSVWYITGNQKRHANEHGHVLAQEKPDKTLKSHPWLSLRPYKWCQGNVVNCLLECWRHHTHTHTHTHTRISLLSNMHTTYCFKTFKEIPD